MSGRTMGKKACGAVLAVLLAACAFGCSSKTVHYAEGESAGFGMLGDTVVLDRPVTVTLYVDDAVRYHGDAKRGLWSLENLEERYQSQNRRSQVTFNNVYVPYQEIERMAREGFDGVCDGVIAEKNTVAMGCEAGTIDAGTAGLSVRDGGYHFSPEVRMVRAVGSDAELPPAATLTGKSDTQFNRIQQIPNYDGLIAVADPSTREGRCANRLLYKYGNGLYTAEDGVSGEYADSIKSKIAVYPDQAAVMEAVSNGECQLGWGVGCHLEVAYPGVEELDDLPNMQLGISLAAPVNAPNPGVARDFFECIIFFD